MASTLCQNGFNILFFFQKRLKISYCLDVFQNCVTTLSQMVNHFLSKSSKLCVIRIIRFRTNTYQVMNGKTLDLDISISNGNIKYSIGKSFLQ